MIYHNVQMVDQIPMGEVTYRNLASYPCSDTKDGTMKRRIIWSGVGAIHDVALASKLVMYNTFDILNSTETLADVQAGMGQNYGINSWSIRRNSIYRG